MKGVIPAAGLGARFLPVTKEQPKEMLPVVDRPVIHWVVGEAIAAGVTDLLIITGREKRAIEDYFDGSLRWNRYAKTNGDSLLREIEEFTSKASFHFVRQKDPKGLGDAILQAEKHVGSEPFLVILGDTIHVSKIPVARQLWDVHQRLQHPVIAVERVRTEKIPDYGIVRVDGWLDERILRVGDLVEKPEPEEAPSDVGISGSYVLTPAVFDAIRSTPPGSGGEIQLTDALRILLESEPIYGYKFEGRRFDIGTKMDWFRAHVELTLMNEEYRATALEFLKGLVRDG